MKPLGYYFVYIILKLIALLPFRAIYVLSDVVSFVLYQVVGYRRKVVRTNLLNSFPDKNAEWIKQTEKRFYQNLADNILENVKLLHVQPQQLMRRFTFENHAIISDLSAHGKSVFIALGHCSNWETITHTLSFQSDVPFIAIYKKLSSNTFDQFMLHLRTQFGRGEMVESQSTFRTLAAKAKTPHAIVLLGDQTPPGLATDYWVDFLNQDTPFFNGLDKMARALGHAVVYLDTKRTKRGHYQVSFRLICADGKQTKPNEITAEYVRLLEESIQNQPHNWLWSHRRWKHKRPASA